MSRKRPHCCYCGEPLAKSRRPTIELKFGVPGKPTIGWHADRCYEADDLAREFERRELKKTTLQPLADKLKKVKHRGQNRVIGGKPLDEFLNNPLGF